MSYYKIPGLLETGYLDEVQTNNVLSVMDDLDPEHEYFTEEFTQEDLDYGSTVAYTSKEIRGVLYEHFRHIRSGQTYIIGVMFQEVL